MRLQPSLTYDSTVNSPLVATSAHEGSGLPFVLPAVTVPEALGIAAAIREPSSFAEISFGVGSAGPRRVWVSRPHPGGDRNSPVTIAISSGGLMVRAVLPCEAAEEYARELLLVAGGA